MTVPTPFEYDPLDPRVLEDPYPYYAHLRHHAPVYRLPKRGFFAVSRHADVVGVLRRPELFSSAAMAAAVTRMREYSPEREEPDPADPEEYITVVGSDGARHARLRGVLNRGFTPGRVAALAPRVRALAQRLAGPLLEAGAGDFVGDFAERLPVTVIAELLDVDSERRGDFRRWADAAMVGLFESPGAEEARRVGETMQEMGDYFDAVIEERRRRPGDDLVSTLVRAEDEQGALTPTEVKTFAFTLLVAGSVTTTHLLANAMRALVLHPEELARVTADPALIPSMLEEAIRYDSPVHMLWRTATRDVEVAGLKIPEGAVVAPLFASANRDEAVFPEPERFDVLRDPREHVGFGHGIHFCLGAALARLEARVSFQELLPRMRKPVLDEEPVRWRSSLVFRGPAHLRLRFGRS